MKTRITILLVLALAVTSPLTASAQQLFDFLGQTEVPGAVGGTLTLRSVVDDPYPAATPVPLDFGAYQYTLVVTGLVLDADGPTQSYSGGVIAIYEDASTPADPADPASYIDGALVLEGVVTTLDRTMFTATLGSVLGAVDWTGGASFSLLSPLDVTDWPFFAGVNARDGYAANGYDEVWDGKVEPRGGSVADETLRWGDIKRMY